VHYTTVNPFKGTIKSKLFRTEQQTPSDLRSGYVP